MQLDVNSFEHRRQVARNIRIPKANDAIAFLFEPSLPLTISLGGLILIVVSAIELNDKPLRRAEEVHDIRTDRRLTSEMRPLQRNFFQRAPQDALVRRCVGSQFFRGGTAD